MNAWLPKNSNLTQAKMSFGLGLNFWLVHPQTVYLLLDQCSTTQIQKKGTSNRGWWRSLGFDSLLLDLKHCSCKRSLRFCSLVLDQLQEIQKKSQRLRHPPPSKVSSWLKSTADFLSCICSFCMCCFVSHQYCHELLTWNSGKPEVPCFLMTAMFFIKEMITIFKIESLNIEFLPNLSYLSVFFIAGWIMPH